MENNNGDVHIETDEARGGSTPGIVRWVLGIGLLLAVVGLSLSWIIPAMTRDGGDRAGVAEPQPGVGQDQAAAATGSDTDSIVGEEADELGDRAAAPATGSAQGSTETGAVPTADNAAKAQ